MYCTSSFGSLKQWHLGYLSDEDNLLTVTMHMPTWRPNGLVISKDKFRQYAANPNKLRVWNSDAWHVWGGECSCLMDDGTYKTGVWAGNGDKGDEYIKIAFEGDNTADEVYLDLTFDQVRPINVEPTADATPSDANADDHLPTGQGGQTRKRKSGGAQRAAKAAKQAEDENGGFTDKGRLAFRNEGGVLVTGNKRTCVPDAISQLLPAFSIKVDIETVRSMMQNDPDQDTKFTKADEYVQQYDLTLQRVTQRFMVKGGPELALLNTTGFFVVQLTIAYNKDDKVPDKHCVAYDGLTVRDNYKHSKVKEIDATDRSSPENARAVFNSLFPKMQVRIKNVYELSGI